MLMHWYPSWFPTRKPPPPSAPTYKKGALTVLPEELVVQILSAASKGGCAPPSTLRLVSKRICYLIDNHYRDLIQRIWPTYVPSKPHQELKTCVFNTIHEFQAQCTAHVETTQRAMTSTWKTLSLLAKEVCGSWNYPIAHRQTLFSYAFYTLAPCENPELHSLHLQGVEQALAEGADPHLPNLLCPPLFVIAATKASTQEHETFLHTLLQLIVNPNNPLGTSYVDTFVSKHNINALNAAAIQENTLFTQWMQQLQAQANTTRNT